MKKVKLVGGPDHGKVVKVNVVGAGYGEPVMYRHDSFVRTEVCNSAECPERGKHKVEVWNRMFIRNYKTRVSFKGKKKIVEYHYCGES